MPTQKVCVYGGCEHKFVKFSVCKGVHLYERAAELFSLNRRLDSHWEASPIITFSLIDHENRDKSEI